MRSTHVARCGAALLLGLALAAQFAGCTPRERPGAPSARANVAGRATTNSASSTPDAGVVVLRSEARPSPPIRGVSVLTLELHGLQPLASGHYEGWALFADERVSTGKFTVSREGVVTALNGAVIAAFPLTRDIVAAQRVTITIEPEGDRDGIASGITVLEGPLVNGRATLALPIDLTRLAGGFTLMSPTDTDPTNEASGLWFFDRTTRQASLTLPDLPAGWVYEGWLGSQGLTFSSGRFRHVAGPDLAAPFSGPRPGLSVPGEDLVARLPGTVRVPVNLVDGVSTVAISIEPDRAGQDPTGPAPFWLLVLRRQIPQGAETSTLLPMDADTTVAPTGVATVG